MYPSPSPLTLTVARCVPATVSGSVHISEGEHVLLFAMQMQVIVPSGVGPGMSFIVNTPSGQQMQVVCPPNATAGSPMIVNVPQQAQAAPVAVAYPPPRLARIASTAREVPA